MMDKGEAMLHLTERKKGWVTNRLWGFRKQKN